MGTKELIIVLIGIFILVGLFGFLSSMSMATIMLISLGLCALTVLCWAVWQKVADKQEENEMDTEAMDEETTSETDEPIQQTSPRTKGRVWGTFGMLYMAGYALYINSVINGAEVNNLGKAIGKAAAIKLFSPFFYCVLAAALISLVGVVGKNKICVLLALAATIGAAFILPGAFEMLIIPAVFFLISYVRMAK